MPDLDAPSPKEVEKFHENSDKDGKSTSQHHTLGSGHNQASPGDHVHDGGSSKLLMDGITVSGAKGGNVALTNLITQLAAVLGFTDATT